MSTKILANSVPSSTVATTYPEPVWSALICAAVPKLSTGVTATTPSAKPSVLQLSFFPVVALLSTKTFAETSVSPPTTIETLVLEGVTAVTASLMSVTTVILTSLETAGLETLVTVSVAVPTLSPVSTTLVLSERSSSMIATDSSDIPYVKESVMLSGSA